MTSLDDMNSAQSSLSLPLPLPLKNGSEDRPQQAFVRIMSGGLKNFGMVYPIDVHTGLAVGRSKGQINIDHPGLAPLHAIFRVEKGIIYVTDQGGEQGTFVENIRIRPGRMIILQQGEKLRLGEVLVQVFTQRERKANEQEGDSEDILPPLPPECGEDGDPGEIPPLLQQQKIDLGVDLGLSYPAAATAKASGGEKEKKVRSSKNVGVLWRLSAMGVDFFYSTLLSLNLLYSPYAEFIRTPVIPFFQSLLPLLSPHEFEQKVVQIIYFLVPVLPIYFGLRIIGLSILGVSFGQFSLGLSGGEGFLWNRLGGMMNGVLSIFTTPLWWLCDWPCLWGKRTCKEFLTLTSLKRGGYLRVFLGLLIFPPLFFVLTIIWPLWTLPVGMQEGAIFLPALKNSTSNFKANNNNNNSLQTPAPKVQTSLHYQMSLPWQQNSSFSLLPAFDVMAKEDGHVITPFLSVYDFQHKIAGQFKVQRLVPWEDQLMSAWENSPLWQKQFPFLAPIFLEDRGHLRPSSTSPSILNLRQKEELQKMIMLSLQLKNIKWDEYAAESFMALLRNYGVFLFPFIEMKKSIYSLVMLGGNAHLYATPAHLGNHQFLLLERDSQQRLTQQATRQWYLLPIDTFMARLFIFDWERSEWAQESVENFLALLGPNLTWHFDDYQGKEQIALSLSRKEGKNIVAGDSAPALWGPIELLDLYAKKNLTANLRSELEYSLQQLLWPLGQSAVAEKDKKLTGLLQEHLTNIIRVTQLLNATPTTEGEGAEIQIGARPRGFADKLKELQRNLQEGNINYFLPATPATETGQELPFL